MLVRSFVCWLLAWLRFSFVCVLVCLLVCLSASLFVCLFVCVFVGLFVCLSVCLFVCLIGLLGWFGRLVVRFSCALYVVFVACFVLSIVQLVCHGVLS